MGCVTPNDRANRPDKSRDRAQDPSYPQQKKTKTDDESQRQPQPKRQSKIVETNAKVKPEEQSLADNKRRATSALGDNKQKPQSQDDLLLRQLSTYDSYSIRVGKGSRSVPKINTYNYGSLLNNNPDSFEES